MRRALIVLPLLTLLLVPAACSTKHKAKLACQVSAVSPRSQPAARTPGAALDWYLAHLAATQHLPTTGYVQEGRKGTRVVYRDASRRNRIGVGNFGTSKQPNWAVENTITC